MPDVIEAETGAFTPEVVEGLRAMGHTVEVPGEEEGNSRRSSHVWGNLQTVAWDLSTNTLSGGPDPSNPVGAAQVALSSPSAVREAPEGHSPERNPSPPTGSRCVQAP